MRVLITGITGFAGSHLAEYILANHPDTEVFGIVRWRSRMDNIVQVQDKVRLIEADIKDMVSLRAVLAESKPDRIFHLAAQSFVPTPGPARPRRSPSTPSARSTSSKPSWPSTSSRGSRSPARARSTARSSPTRSR